MAVEIKKIFKQILGGDILVANFVLKQSKLFVLLLILSMLFISNKYSCLNKVVEINILEDQLKDIKAENLIVMTELISRSRLSKIEKVLKLQKLDFFLSKNSIFELYK